MPYPAYIGIKRSYLLRLAHKKCTRLYTTAEVARMLGVHKMVVLRWLAKGEINYPAYYCIHRAVTLLWNENEVRSLGGLRKR